MNQENNYRGQNNLSPDIAYICRLLWKNAFVILMCTCIVGVGAYVFMDHFMKESYTATVQLAVIGRDNTSGRFSDGSVNSAVTRNLNVLNSDTLKDQIRKDKGALPGSIRASRVGDTNFIAMSATSNSAADAFRLLKAALDNYPTLSGYFESGYILRNLTGFSAENIALNGKRTLYNALLAALLVFAGGCGLTVMFCITTDRIHNREQAAVVLDLDVLGVMHSIHKKKNQKAILISDEKTDITYIEEIDKVATHVLDRMQAGGHKTLMVNSLYENEGKSTIAVNLALNFARRGKRVALVDADMRRPAVVKIFDKTLEDDRSLSAYLSGEVSLSHVLYKDTTEEGLYFILQGKAVSEPDKFFESEQFRKFISDISRHVDYVIFDTPPIGIVRDAELIAGSVDAALLILQQDTEKAAEVNDVVDVLDETGTTVLGCILNFMKDEWPAGNRAGGSYGRYYGRYGRKS